MGTCPSMPKFANKFWEKSTEVKAEAKKATRFYPAEDIKKKLGNHHNTTKQTKLRKSITPGTVLILLAGTFKVNGVPLRRVPQSYVIATQTSVDVSDVKVPAEVNDEFFKKPRQAKKKDDELFFEKEKESTIDD